MIMHNSEDAEAVLEKTYQMKMEQMKPLPMMKASWDKFLWATQMQLEDTVVVIVNAREQKSKMIKEKKQKYREAYLEAERIFLQNHKRADLKINSLKRQADAKVKQLDDEIEDYSSVIERGEDLRAALQERIRSIKVIARVEHRDL